MAFVKVLILNTYKMGGFEYVRVSKHNLGGLLEKLIQLLISHCSHLLKICFRIMRHYSILIATLWKQWANCCQVQCLGVIILTFWYHFLRIWRNYWRSINLLSTANILRIYCEWCGAYVRSIIMTTRVLMKPVSVTKQSGWYSKRLTSPAQREKGNYSNIS
jgi:hypothetical protein